ncbi:MAG TPA: polymorphic toxin-type HINT domain-containing protein [Isosphaeraceae bacterium]|jgi:hypothetical protein|nr:polymorphic toxin-type HINT domain-containing protein [Isosphaeraceae bacterium]
MFPLILACAALLAGDEPKPPPPKPTEAELAEYERRRDAAAKSRSDAVPHVRLALWCEAHHMPEQRRKQLALALLKAPSNALVRGLVGHVHDGESWARPDVIASRVKADAELSATLAEYERRRAAAPETADGQWTLALWCEQHGLKPEARAHLATVVRLDPRRDVAWKRLGYKKRDGRWATDADLAAAKAEAEAQRKADRHWTASFEKWQKALGAKGRRDAAEAALAGVTDPRAVPAILRVFARGGEADQLRAVQLLGQIDSPQASRTLAMMAVFADPVAVRRAAAATLRHRDPREFADVLIALLRDPIKFEVRDVNGPGQPGVLFIEGKEANLQRNYRPQDVPQAVLMPGDVLGLDPNGNLVARRTLGLVETGFANWRSFFPPTATMATNPAAAQALQGMMNQAGVGASGAHALGAAGAQIGAGALAPGAFGGLPMMNPFQIMIQASALAAPLMPTTSFNFTSPIQADIPIGRLQAQAQLSAAVAAQQLRADVAMIEKVNRAIQDGNDRVAAILKDVSGQGLGADREKWKAWWVDQLGYAYTPPKPRLDRPTVVEDVPVAYQPAPIPVEPFLGAPVAFDRMSCFGAGTLVRTRTGPRPIEEIRVGDLVLAQDTTTGALSFRPVLFTHHNPPSKTLKIKLEGDEVVASTFHRFWVAGRGWVMARDLKPGDPLRLLVGPAAVVAIEPGPSQQVYNLDVADDADFFAGRRAALVHDNTLPDPRAVPFDAPKPDGPRPPTPTRTPTK